MPWWVIVCCGVFGAFVLVSGLMLAAAAFGFFRRLKSSLRAVGAELEQVTRASEELSRKSEAAAQAAARLERERAVLDASVARLRVLAWALEDVRALVAAARGTVPTK